MKTITSILFVCFAVLFSQGQNQLKLSVKQGSNAPNYETEHMYLLELSNPSSKVSNVAISMNNIDCGNVKKADQTEFNQQLLDQNKQSGLQQIVVQPGKSVEFYVKLSRKSNARLNTWNCTEIAAKSTDGKTLSNTITIESLIPNPNNNN